MRTLELGRRRTLLVNLSFTLAFGVEDAFESVGQDVSLHVKSI